MQHLERSAIGVAALASAPVPSHHLETQSSMSTTDEKPAPSTKGTSDARAGMKTEAARPNPFLWLVLLICYFGWSAFFSSDSAPAAIGKALGYLLAAVLIATTALTVYWAVRRASGARLATPVAVWLNRGAIISVTLVIVGTIVKPYLDAGVQRMLREQQQRSDSAANVGVEIEANSSASPSDSVASATYLGHASLRGPANSIPVWVSLDSTPGDREFKQWLRIAMSERAQIDTADVITILLSSAKQGHAEAAYYLATHFLPSGTNVAANPDLGLYMKWLFLSADRGYPPAERTLGRLFLTPPADYFAPVAFIGHAGHQLLESAAGHGLIEAQDDLGYFANESGDKETAFFWCSVVFNNPSSTFLKPPDFPDRGLFCAKNRSAVIERASAEQQAAIHRRVEQWQSTRARGWRSSAEPNTVNTHRLDVLFPFPRAALEKLSIQGREAEERHVTAIWPDWRLTLRLAPFNDWYGTRSPEEQKLAQSQHSGDAIKMLRMFENSKITASRPDALQVLGSDTFSRWLAGQPIEVQDMAFSSRAEDINALLARYASLR